MYEIVVGNITRLFVIEDGGFLGLYLASG